MKRIWFVILLICLAFCFVSCAKKETSDSDNASLSQPCAHEWKLISFVTEETEIPFAGSFYCEKCGRREVHSFSFTDIGIPLISVTGNLSPIYENENELSKDVKVKADLSYRSNELCFDATASFSYQGKSTTEDPKKNFSVNILDESGKKKKMTFRDSWGAGSKYVLKSNYIDPSAARNLIMANLYGEIAHDRGADDVFSTLVNGGAVDGYLVLFYLNGAYQGLYNWDIRKDAWLYGMGDEDAAEAVLCGSATADYGNEDGIEISEEGLPFAKSWSYEYVNESFAQEDWAIDSFNAMLTAVKNASAEELPLVLAEYMILDRATDVVLFSLLFGGVDNVSGNQVWCTYDGKKWTPVVYDMDRTLGRSGWTLISPSDSLTDILSENLLYRLILEGCYDTIKDRYLQLRKSILTTENVMAIFDRLLKGVDDLYFAAEAEKWPNADWHFAENAAEITGFGAEADYIKSYLDARFNYCDTFFAEHDASDIVAILT